MIALVLAVACACVAAGLPALAGADPTFNATGRALRHADGFAQRGEAIVVLPDGGAVVAGTQASLSGSAGRLLLAGFLEDGAPAPAFGTGGTSSLDLGGRVTGVAGIVRLGDGRLVVAGTLEDEAGSALFVARCTPDGLPDVTFHGNGHLVERSHPSLNAAAALAVQADGKILVGGSMGVPERPGDRQAVIVRFTAAGALDPTFGSAGRSLLNISSINNETFAALALLQDGRIVAAGGADRDRLHVARYTPAGLLDTTFGERGVTTDYQLGPACALAVLADGRYVVAGNRLVSIPGSAVADDLGYLQRLAQNGTIDYALRRTTGWMPSAQGMVPNGKTLDRVRGLAVYPNGKLVTVGSAGGRLAFGVHAPDGAWDAAFGSGGISRTDLSGPSQGAALALRGYARIYGSGTAGDDLLLAVDTGASPLFAAAFVQPEFRVNESGGQATVTVRLGAALSTAASVEYATSDGSAGAADYVAAQGTLAFPPGSTEASFQVTLTADALDEGDESVTLTLAQPVGVVLGAPNPAALVISDAPRLSFERLESAGAERVGSMRVAVRLDAPAATAVSADLASAGGTAVAGVDYGPLPARVTIPAGQVLATFDVPLASDDVTEGEETAVLALVNVHGASLLPGGDAMTLRIVDDVASCSACAEFAASERTAAFSLTVDLSSIPVEGALVDYRTVEGTARAGADFAATSGTLYFPPGGGAQVIVVPIVHDALFDPDETFAIAFSGTAVPQAGPLVTVRIRDASLVVDSAAQTGDGCTLASAIASANADRSVGGCDAGSGEDLIVLPAGTYPMHEVLYQDTFYCCGGDGPFGHGPAALPGIQAPVHIIGAGIGQTILERAPAAPEMRFFTNHAELWLDGMTLRGSRNASSAPGYKSIDTGGGALIGGTVHARAVLFEFNASPGVGGVFTSGTLEASDCRFEHNTSAGGGGVVGYATLVATDSAFLGNHAAGSGGVYYQACNGTISATRTVFSGNVAASHGGAIYAGACYSAAAAVTLVDSRLDTNLAEAGNGGAAFVDAAVSISGTLFLANKAASAGGALYGALSGAVSRSTFDGNLGGTTGGAIEISDAWWGRGTLTIGDSTFVRNAATQRGGAVRFTGQNGVLVNGTFTANGAGESGSALSAAGNAAIRCNNLTVAGHSSSAAVSVEGATLTIANSVVAGNTADWIRTAGIVTSLGHNVIGSSTGSGVAWSATDLVGSHAARLDPQLGDLLPHAGTTETMLPAPGSPLIDAGSPEAPGSGGAACEAADQRGVARPGGGSGSCDIGAAERVVTATAALAARKSALPERAYVGDEASFRITVVNDGGAAASDVVVTDPLPATMAFAGVAASRGTCAVEGQVVTCHLGTLPAGSSATVDVTVTPQAAGLLWNTAHVAAGTGLPPEGLVLTAGIVPHEPIRVTTTAQAGAPGECSLADAIRAAGSDQPVNGCGAGSGWDLILLPAGTFLMSEIGSYDTYYSGGYGPYSHGPTALPAIRGRVEIRGSGQAVSVLRREPFAPEMRFFYNTGELTLTDLTLAGGRAATSLAGYRGVEPDGGAIYGGAVVARGVLFDSNTSPRNGGAQALGTLRASDCRFERNEAVNVGGAVALQAAFDVERSTFKGNRAAFGGAVDVGCNPVMRAVSSLFEANSATGVGGAIHASACYGLNRSLTLVDTAVIGNSAGTDGGGLGGDSSLVLTRARFEGNHAAVSGGAVAGFSGLVEESSFTDNTAGHSGGAMSSGSGAYAVRASLFARNTAGYRGGAIALRSGGSSLRNSTFSANDATDGAALWVSGSGERTVNNVTVTASPRRAILLSDGTPTLTLSNSIVAGNLADVYVASGTLASRGHNLVGIGNGTNVTWDPSDRTGTAAAALDAQLAPLAQNGGSSQTHALRVASPAFDGGDPGRPGSGGSACEAVDQRGAARPGDGSAACDIGAFEAVSGDFAADLSWTAAADPATAIDGLPLTFNLELHNRGEVAATGVLAEVRLPEHATLMSVTVSQGAWSAPPGGLVLHVGTLPVGTTATIAITVIPQDVGEQVVEAVASAVQRDAVPDDNALHLAPIAQPSPVLGLDTVLPTHGGDGGLVFVALKGLGLTESVSIALARAGMPDVPGNVVEVAPGGLALIGYFDLRGVSRGIWDVVATRPDGSSAVLGAAFTVEEARRPDLYFDILGPETTRPGRTLGLSIVIGNRGNADAHAVPITIAVPSWLPMTAGFNFGSIGQVPGAPAYDRDAFPSNITSRDGTRRVMQIVVRTIPAGGRVVLPIGINTPMVVAAESFTIEGTAYAPMMAPAGAITLPEGVEGGLSLNPCNGTSPTAPGRACLYSIFSEVMNIIGLLPAMAGAEGCVAGAVTNGMGSLFSLCESYAGAGGKGLDKEALSDTFQGIAAAVAATAVGCIEGALERLNLALTVYQIGSGLTDIAKTCFNMPINVSLYKAVRVLNSRDPNEKSGPSGAGAARYITADRPLAYTIDFENKPDASGAAQDVVISDPLDVQHVDLDTFAFGPVRFGETQVELPPGLDTHAVADLRPGNNLLVSVRATLDAEQGIATWRFASLDPVTGNPTEDAVAGFLPPNVNSPEGQGSVTYFVAPKAGLADGTTIVNGARIVFDANPPLDTNTWVNTIDATPPVSHIEPLAARQSSSRFAVSWQGSDAVSGVRDYTVLVSEDGGPFEEWLIDRAATTAEFSGRPGHTYAFASTARDNGYNRETKPPVAQASTVVPGITVSLVQSGSPWTEGAGLARFVVTRSGATDDATAVDFATADGTATAGVDYLATSGTLQFAAGEVEKAIEIPLLDDAQLEPDEEFTLALSQPTGGSSIGLAQAVATIADDEPPAVVSPGLQAGYVGEQVNLVLTAEAPHGEQPSFSAVGLPEGVSLAPASGVIAGTISKAALGTHSVTLGISDSRGASQAPAFTWSVAARSARLGVRFIGSGRGAVTSAPGGIACPGACAKAYGQGATIALTATPAPGSVFVGWSGAGCGSRVTLSRARTCKARFEALRTLSVGIASTNGGLGRVTSAPDGIACGAACEAAFVNSTRVRLTATPAPGSTFAGWSGACRGRATTCTVQMSAARQVTATFAK